MSMQDPLGDMLTRIRNAQMAGYNSVSVPSSTLKIAVAEVLKDEGYISGMHEEGSVKKNMQIALKYYGGKPVILDLKRISRPGLRKYTKKGDIPSVNGGMGISIVSTSQGVMTGKVARSKSIGGEVLCTVF